jgi:hypothetical protein
MAENDLASGNIENLERLAALDRYAGLAATQRRRASRTSFET